MATARVTNPSHFGVLGVFKNLPFRGPLKLGIEYRYNYVTGGRFMRGTESL